MWKLLGYIMLAGIIYATVLVLSHGSLLYALILSACAAFMVNEIRLINRGR